MSKKSETVALVVSNIMEDLEPVVRHHVERVLTVCEAAARATAIQYGADFTNKDRKSDRCEKEKPAPAKKTEDELDDATATAVSIEVGTVDSLEELIKLMAEQLGDEKAKAIAEALAKFGKTSTKKRPASK